MKDTCEEVQCMINRNERFDKSKSEALSYLPLFCKGWNLKRVIRTAVPECHPTYWVNRIFPFAILILLLNVCATVFAATPPVVEVDYKQNYELAPNSSSSHTRYQTSTVRTYYNSKEIRASAAHIVKISVPAGWKARIDARITDLTMAGNPYYLWYDLSCNGHAVREYGSSAKAIATQTVYSDCYAAVISRCLPEGGSSCAYSVSYSISVLYERSGPRVEFNANGGDGKMDAQAFESGKSQNLNANLFTRAGFSFKGWAKSPDGSVVYSDRQSISISSDTTLYAVWTEAKPVLSIENGKLIGVELKGAVSISIPNTVASIGDEVFYGCKELTGVSIPNSVTNIGMLAFCNTGLKSVAFPGKMKSIGDWAFAHCNGLGSLTIPDEVTNIGGYAFYGCGNLENVRIGRGVEGIGCAAFSNCACIKSFVVESGNPFYKTVGSMLVETACGKVVAVANSISAIDISDVVKSIGGWAFSNCSQLSRVSIPSSVLTIEDNAFCNCQKLESVRLPVWFKGNLPSGVFSNCSSALSVVYYYAEMPAAYTVKFDANGGSLSGTGQMLVAKDCAIGDLPLPSYKGYLFCGWFTAKTGGIQIAKYTKPESDMTYYAHWQFVGEADEATIAYQLEANYEAEEDGALKLNLTEKIGSISTPKISVKGLPTGLKYDAKTGLISGAATKPGVYKVTVSATNKTVTKPVTATFELTVPNLSCGALPNLEPATDAYGIVTCGVAFDPGLVDCSPEDGWTVKAAGLPTGLKLVQDKKTGACSITGVPTKAGTFTVTFTASKKGEKNQVATITLVTEALPEWAVGTFSGFVECYAGQGSGSDFGSVTMTVAANGKVSGKMALVGTNYTFSAASYATVTDDGCFVVDAEAKAGKVVRPLRLLVIPCDAPGSSPSLFNARAIGSLDSPLASEILMCRGMWKDKATAAVAKTAIAKWEGVYTLSLDSGDGGEFGIGYLSLTVGKDGNIKATGKLADGTSVSATTPLMYDGETGFLACLYFAPSAYKGGSLAMSIGFNEGEGGVRTLGNSRGIAQWTSRNPQATCDYGEGFDYAIEFTGAYYNKLAKLNEYYEALRLEIATPLLQYTYKDTIIDEDTGKKVTESYLDDADAEETDGELTVTVDEKGVLIVPRATKPVYDKENAEWLYGGVNDGALTLSFTQATGIFKGSYTFWYDYESAYDASTEKSTIVHTSKKVNFEGVLVQGEEPEIRGFYLWDATGTYDDPKTGKEKAYKYKESYPVYLVRP